MRPAGAIAALAALAAGIASPAAAQTALVADLARLGPGQDGGGVEVRPPRPLALPVTGRAPAFPLRWPSVVAARGGSMLVQESMADRVLRVDPRGRVTVVRRNGRSLADDCAGRAPDGGRLEADPSGNRVRSYGPEAPRVLAGTGLTGFAGDGGPATDARLATPTCALAMPDGGVLVADHGNARVRRIAPDGVITTVAGDGTRVFRGEGHARRTGLVPWWMAHLPGGSVAITDDVNARVYRLDPDGRITVLAGNGARGYAGDGGPARDARLWAPWGVAAAPGGAVLVSDVGSQTVRRIDATGVITTVLGAPGGRRAPAIARPVHAPSRRLVTSWREGALAVADVAGAGRHALVRIGVPGMGPDRTVVVHGGREWSFDHGDPEDATSCWYPSSDRAVLVGRDLGGPGARDGLVPGSGPAAPALPWGRLVLVRVPLELPHAPEFGVPALVTRLQALRLAEYLVDPGTGRVVAAQRWTFGGVDRRYTIRPAQGRLRTPPTAPRQVATLVWGVNMLSCGRGTTPYTGPFGHVAGVALARRVEGRLTGVPGLLGVFRSRGSGREIRGRLVVRLVGGAAPASRMTAEGARRGELDGLAVTGRRGTFVRVAGARCWRDVGDESGVAREVVPMSGAYYERPVRRGRLTALPVRVAGLSGELLVDTRDMRLAGARWRTASAGWGALRLRESPRAPRLPAPRPACAGPIP